MDKWRRLQTRLLYAMAVHLGYKMEQLDILEGYIPQVWGTVEEQQRALLQQMIELLSGNRVLPVQIRDQQSPATNVRPLCPGR